MGFRDRKRTVQRANGSDESFAVREVNLATQQDQGYLRSVVSKSSNGSIRPWQWVREIGEVHYALGRGERVAGYGRINAYKLNQDGTVGKVVTGGLPGQVASTIQSVYGGRRGLLERYYKLQKVPGDAYLIRTRDENGEPSGYDWLSSSEIDTTGLSGRGGDERFVVLRPNTAVKRIVLKDGVDGDMTVDIAAEDFLGRVWRPAGQFVEEPDSPMRALDGECEMLHTLTLSIKGRILSRFAMNGIIYFPQGINTVLSPAPAGKPNTFHSDTTLNRIIEAMTWAVTHPDDPRSRIPIMMIGEGDLGKQIQQIMVDAAIDETDIKLRAELIDRILMGLDVQPGQVKEGREVNHWQNWYQTDDERRVNVAPDLETMCWAMTRLVLWKQMKEAGHKPGAILNTVLWYDLSAANVKTNLAEDGRQLRDRGLMSDAGTRRVSGITEEDAPTEAEYARMVGFKTGNPFLALQGLKIQGEIDWEQVEKVAGNAPGPDANSPAPDSKVGPGKGDPGSPNKADRKTDTPARLRPA